MLRGAALVYKAGFAGGVTLAAACFAIGQSTPAGPDFQEVYGLIRAHVPNVTAAELDQAAVQGIFSNLGDKVALIGERGVAAANVLTRTNIFEDSIGYARAETVSRELPEALRLAWASLSSTNRLKGLVLDLRYAGGNDYGAAAGTAGLFLKKREPVLDFGQGMVESEPVGERIGVPVAVLVNGATTSAAEALAAILRETGTGLILGSKTAGKAMMYSDYPLKSGGALRVFRGPVSLGNGKELETDGVKPDIPVDVAAAEERAFFVDAFRAPTNSVIGAGGPVRRSRLNEAELTRERREGGGAGELLPPRARRPEPDPPVVSDPVLARALDLLKGLAVVRKQS